MDQFYLTIYIQAEQNGNNILTHSSKPSVATAALTGACPFGDYKVDVIQTYQSTGIKTAPTTVSPDNGLCQKISNTSVLNQAGLYIMPASGTLKVNNGSNISYNVGADSLNTVLTNISNDWGAYVDAGYDGTTDKVTLTLKNGGKITAGNTLTNAGFETRVTANGNLQVNGVNFAYTAAGTTLDSLITSINNSTDVHVQAVYDPGSGTLQFGLENSGRIYDNVALKDAGFGTDLAGAGNLTINGQNFAYDATTTKLSDIITAINNSTNIHVQANYNFGTDTFNFTLENGGNVYTTQLLQDAGFANDPSGASTIKINGQTLNFAAGTHTLQNVIDTINASNAYVNASYAGDKLNLAVRNGGKITTGNTLATAGFGTRASGTSTLTINGKSQNFDASTASTQNILDWINNTSNSYVTASYNAGTDMVYMSLNTGTDGTAGHVNRTVGINGNSGFNTKITAAGNFTINGVAIAYDGNTTLDGLIGAINADVTLQGQNITAGYDAVNDKLQIVDGDGDVINIGDSGDINQALHIALGNHTGTAASSAALGTSNIIVGGTVGAGSVIDAFRMNTGTYGANYNSAGAVGTYTIDLTGSTEGGGSLMSAFNMTAGLKGSTYSSSAVMGTYNVNLASSTAAILSSLRLDSTVPHALNYSSTGPIGTYNVSLNGSTAQIVSAFKMDQLTHNISAGNYISTGNMCLSGVNLTDSGTLFTALRLASGGSSISSSEHLGGPVKTNVSATNTYASGKTWANLWNPVTAGNFFVNDGITNHTVTVNNGDSLDTIIGKINALDPGGIVATWDGAANQFQIVTNNTFTISVTNGTSNFATVMFPDGTVGTGGAGANSIFKINGVEYNGANNTIKDVIPGVTLTLNSAGSTTVSFYKQNQEINQEINQLLQELSDISTTTQFNGRNILDGSLSGGNAASFHGGSETGHTLMVDINDMGISGLGLNPIFNSHDLGSQILTIDEAIQKVSTQRANIGAFQNRIMSRATSNDNNMLNTRAAESRIRDVDMAKEMLDFVKGQLLTKVNTTLMANIKASSKNALFLLR